MTAARSPGVGTVLTIPLGEGRVAFGRLLHRPLVEFYERTAGESDSVDVESIVRDPVIFRIWVMDKATSGRRWAPIGTVPLTAEESAHREVFFKQDVATGRLSSYWSDPVTGEVHEQPISLADSRTLEAAAVWSAEHVEDRLRDHFDGRENKWVRSLRPKEDH